MNKLEFKNLTVTTDMLNFSKSDIANLFFYNCKLEATAIDLLVELRKVDKTFRIELNSCDLIDYKKSITELISDLSGISE